MGIGYNLGDLTELQTLLLNSPDTAPEPPPAPPEPEPEPIPIPLPEPTGCHPKVLLSSIRSTSMESITMVVPEIFRSKRFWSAVIGLVMMVLTNLVPEMAEHADALIPSILVIVGLLIGGYSFEDVQEAKARAFLAQQQALQALEK